MSKKFHSTFCFLNQICILIFFSFSIFFLLAISLIFLYFSPISLIFLYFSRHFSCLSLFLPPLLCTPPSLYALLATPITFHFLFHFLSGSVSYLLRFLSSFQALFKIHTKKTTFEIYLLHSHYESFVSQKSVCATHLSHPSRTISLGRGLVEKSSRSIDYYQTAVPNCSFCSRLRYTRRSRSLSSSLEPSSFTVEPSPSAAHIYAAAAASSVLRASLCLCGWRTGSRFGFCPLR